MVVTQPAKQMLANQCIALEQIIWRRLINQHPFGHVKVSRQEIGYNFFPYFATLLHLANEPQQMQHIEQRQLPWRGTIPIDDSAEHTISWSDQDIARPIIAMRPRERE